uniref:Uncharacterized protein n=1 Tax=viral metagenome TaxID=1070528 RepID=A0A6M3KP08_9ZZZZ
MSLTAKQGSSFEQIEDGNHHGVCVALIDLGTQYNEIFNKEQPKIMITWELPDFPIVDDRGKPDVEKGYRVISKEYTVSLHEKANLYTDLISWRGRDFNQEELEGFDIKTILGANCLVNVIKNKKGYSQVAAVAKMPKGMEHKKASYQLIYDMDEDIENIPEGVPDWIKDKIKKSKEYMSLGAEPQDDSPPPTDDDIPF